MAASRRSSRSRRAAGSSTPAGRLTVATVRPPAAKPSGVAFSAANVRRNRPAPTIRTSDSAICATTSAPRMLRRRSPVMVRDDSFIASPGATPVTESAGTIPAIAAVTAARPAVKPSTRQSSERSRNTDPRHVASCWTSRPLLHLAKSTPSPAPAATMTAVSTASRRVTRHREAPRASLHAELTAPGQRPRQHQVGQAGAGNQQHDGHRRLHRPQRRLEAVAQRRLPGRRRHERQRILEEALAGPPAPPPSGSPAAASRARRWPARGSPRASGGP